MKIPPELEAIPMSHDPGYADSRETHPDLQLCQAGCATADRCHDHILRAALLKTALHTGNHTNNDPAKTH
jgi:hypothetical protein